MGNDVLDETLRARKNKNAKKKKRRVQFYSSTSHYLKIHILRILVTTQYPTNPILKLIEL